MNIYIGTVILISIFCVIISVLVICHNNRGMERQYDQLLLKLDHAIAGEMQEGTYDESMDSAIVERLNRVVQISGMQKDKAEQERDVVKSLISDISHQVRTPLSNIMLFADLLKEQSSDAETIKLTDKIQKNSLKLDFYMKELIKTSYAEQEMISVHPEKVDVEEIVEKACQSIEVDALRKKIVIEKNLNKAECFADKKWTVEVIGNVLDNAIKYSPEESVVGVSVEIREAFVCVKVADQGIGIPETEQGLVFDRFYRGQQVSQESGFGIGLYLTREVLSKQGGYAKIKSQPGKGTTVEICLSRFAV